MLKRSVDVVKEPRVRLASVKSLVSRNCKAT